MAVMINKHPPSKPSKRARFRERWGGGDDKQANRACSRSVSRKKWSGGMINKHPPSKTSRRARFQGWWGGGDAKQATTLETEQMRSVLRGVLSTRCPVVNINSKGNK